MTTHDTRGKNWTARLVEAIEGFQDGDTIIVATPAAETAHRAAGRMGKTITVQVRDGGAPGENAQTQSGETSPF